MDGVKKVGLSEEACYGKEEREREHGGLLPKEGW
jgi:hypothetical protein